MGRFLLVAVVCAFACTKGSPDAVAPAPSPGDDPTIMKTPPPPKSKITVALTSVTLADDCGGTPPWTAPTAPTTASPKGTTMKSDAPADEPVKADMAKGAKAKRRCEQTSMQLSIV